MSARNPPFVHPLAQIEDDVQIGAGTRVWAGAHIRRGARVGAECVIGAGATIDVSVVVGDRCKVQNAALLYRGLTVGEGVLIGPAAVFTNDRAPRAMTPDGALKSASDWDVSATVIDDGASVGANATVIGGVRIGAWSMIGAGAVVTRDVAPHALVVGVPARRVAWACRCGSPVSGYGTLRCPRCGLEFSVTGA
jgi:acetyltransferase-like isoleucine patch superfamily enzyme